MIFVQKILIIGNYLLHINTVLNAKRKVIPLIYQVAFAIQMVSKMVRLLIN